MFSLVFVLTLLVILAYLAGALFSLTLLINQLAIFVAVMTTVPLARRFLDHRSFVSLGLHPRRAVPDLVAGFVIAGAAMGAIFVVEWRAGWLTIESFRWQTLGWPELATGLAIWLAIFVVGGWQEELLARGYWLQNIADGLNLPWGLFISSVLFALAHLSNPNVSWIAILGLFVAGYFLAYGYVRTRQLWLPIGLHIGWNFFEGTVFGFPVSGLYRDRPYGRVGRSDRKPG
jgi:membrane protease YdiL (CAAX protease family)